MEIRFEARKGDDAEDDAELESLRDWLSDDQELRGSVEIVGVTRPAPAGSMGSGLDAVLAVLGAAAAIGQLPFSYAAWRESRRNDGGVHFHIVGGTAEQNADAARRMRQALEAAGLPVPEDDGAADGGEG